MFEYASHQTLCLSLRDDPFSWRASPPLKLCHMQDTGTFKSRTNTSLQGITFVLPSHIHNLFALERCKTTCIESLHCDGDPLSDVYLSLGASAISATRKGPVCTTSRVHQSLLQTPSPLPARRCPPSAYSRFHVFFFPDNFISTDVPVNLRGRSSTVAPIIENSDRSLTVLASVAELVLRVLRISFHSAAVHLRDFGWVTHESCHQTALGRALPSPPASSDHSTDAHLRPWWSTVEAESAHAYAPQTAWDEGRVALTQPGGSQVPSGPRADPDAFVESWSQGGDAHHAVAALAQPNTTHPTHPVPAWSYMAASSEASSTSQGHRTRLNNVNSWMAYAVPGTPSPAHHRRHHRRPHARLEHVICDKCKKPMRRQSLRRHVREVHHHIKRRHAKSTFPAGP